LRHRFLLLPTASLLAGVFAVAPLAQTPAPDIPPIPDEIKRIRAQLFMGIHVAFNMHSKVRSQGS
jgi:hypothetical protein